MKKISYMQSRGLYPMYIKKSTYERVSESLFRGQPKPKKSIFFDGKKVWYGHKSLDKTKQSRAWQLFWRLKKRMGKFVFKDYPKL